MNHDPTELLDIFQNLGDLKGTIGLVASVIFLVIRLYRLPDWQDSLPENARWENLHTGLKYGIIAGLAAVGSLLASVANGLTWQQALTAGLSAAAAAILTNKLTKTAPMRLATSVVVPPKCPKCS